MRRARARQEGATTEPAKRSDEDVARLETRMFVFVRDTLQNAEPSGVPARQSFEKLRLFGDRAVRYLEQGLLTGVVAPPADAFRIPGTALTAPLVPFEAKPAAAAYSLASLNTEEARQALLRAMRSPDPVVRSAVVAAATNVPALRGGHEIGVTDPVAGIRNESLRYLSATDDKALLPTFERAARDGDPNALRWMVKHAPDRAKGLITDAGLTPPARAQAVRAHLVSEQAPSVDLLNALIEGLRTDEGFVLLGPASNLLAKPEWEALLTPSMRISIEGAAYRALEAGAQVENACAVLGCVGSPRSFSGIIRVASSGKTNMSWVGSLTDTFRRLGERLGPEGFPDVARGLVEFPANPDLSLLQKAIGTVREVSARGVPPEQILAGLKPLGGIVRRQYDLEVVSRCKDPLVIPALVAELKAPHWEKVSGRSHIINTVYTAGNADAIVLVVHGLSDSDGPTAAMSQQLFHQCASKSGARAARVFEEVQGLEAAGDVLMALRFLPELEAIAYFKKAWPHSEKAGNRQRLLDEMNLVKGNEATQVLLEHFDAIESSECRSQVLLRFGTNAFEPAIPVIGKALDDSDPKVRDAARSAMLKLKEYREAKEEFAVWTMGEKAVRESIAELLELLKSDKREVVFGATKSLGVLKAKSALPALVRLLESGDPELRKAVHEAIQAIGN
jgi:HEAT repeat protein